MKLSVGFPTPSETTPRSSKEPDLRQRLLNGNGKEDSVLSDNFGKEWFIPPGLDFCIDLWTSGRDFRDDPTVFASARKVDLPPRSKARIAQSGQDVAGDMDLSPLSSLVSWDSRDTSRLRGRRCPDFHSSPSI